MATIQQYYDYSLLALGAYATGLITGPVNAASNVAGLSRAGFTQLQIESLAVSGWQVVNQSEDALYGDGFSATLFQSTLTGEYVFSNRGTVEFGADLIGADAWGVALMGTAGGQVVDMIRYYKRLVTAEGQAVSYSQDELQRMYSVANWYHPGGYTSVVNLANALTSDTGLGKLSPTQTLTIDGHSLGGHLSLWFKAFFDSSVNQVYTFNGAGLGGAVSSAGTAIVGVFGNITSAISDSRVTNVYGDGGPNIIAAVGGSVGANIGARIEAKSLIESIAAANLYNHSIVTLSDALAVPAMMQRLDPTLTLSKSNALLDAASNQVTNMQEGALDAARRLFGLQTVTPVDDRSDFYTNVKQLNDLVAFQSLAGKVIVELATADDLAAQARTNFSVFLSLQVLSPIILRTDATGQAVLKQANETLAQQWEADQALTPEQREVGLETFTNTYLLDRQALLQYRIVANIKDAIANPDGYLAVQGTRPTQSNLRFIDIGSGTLLQVNTTLPSPSTATNQYVIFGDGNANTITGSVQDDRLYGGGGNDSVNSSDGDDYLQGNAGDDSLDGGTGVDTLLGGAGVDTLVGGVGSDLLLGGAGNDTYYFEGNIGLDIIRDSDGVGKIIVGAPGFEPLSGGKKLAESLWISDDKKFTYALIEDNLVIRSGDANVTGSITIQGWQAGQLNITLSDTLAPATATTTTYTGDFIKKKNTDATQYLLVDGQYVPDGTQADAKDLFTGTAGPDSIQGLGGDDALLGAEGDDIIEGAAGNDVLMGGRGADVLRGGAGRDLIYGSSTGALQYPTPTNYQLVESSYPVLLAEGFNWRLTSPGLDTDGYQHGFLSGTITRDTQAADAGNVIDGGADDDIVYAGTGSDAVRGGSGNDQITGMAGDDVLFGDEGNDRIYGDGPTSNADALIYTPSIQHGRDILYGGIGNDLLIGQGGDDVLYGGADDDFFIGGGNDVLASGAGKDIYIINRGDGADRVVDSSEGNIYRLGAGISKDSLKLRLGSLLTGSIQTTRGRRLHRQLRACRRKCPSSGPLTVGYQMIGGF